jgi:hypothetical protein
MRGSINLGSLRVRLPLLFLLGVVLAGVLAAAISIRFFQSYNHSRAVAELRSEGAGIVRLYAAQAGIREVPVDRLQEAIGGDHIFYVPIVPFAQLFVGHLDPLSPHVIDVRALESAACRRSTSTTRGVTTWRSRGRSSSATSCSAQWSSRSRRRSCTAGS